MVCAFPMHIRLPFQIAMVLTLAQCLIVCCVRTTSQSATGKCSRHQRAHRHARSHRESGQAPPDSLTSPSASQAAGQKRQIPGGFTIKDASSMREAAPQTSRICCAARPKVLASGGETERGTSPKVSVRRKPGIESDDEPLGVQMLLLRHQA